MMSGFCRDTWRNSTAWCSSAGTTSRLQAYGEQPHETVEPLVPQRYEFERKLIARWLAGGKPLLGVCLGMQFTNVVAGGTMVQDIPSEIGTMVDHRKYHRVLIEPESMLATILGDHGGLRSVESPPGRG